VIDLAVSAMTSDDHPDLDAIETALRASMLEIGTTTLESLLDIIARKHTAEPATCALGHRPQHAGCRPKTIMTILCRVVLHRDWYHDPVCGCGHAPIDRLLGIDGTKFSPGLRNMTAYVGAVDCFREGSKHLRHLAGIPVPAKSIERVSQRVGPRIEAYRRAHTPDSDVRSGSAIAGIETMYVMMDAPGIPVLRSQTHGRKGKGADGQAKTRDMKLGCVFRQIRLDAEGYPVRDDATTTYVGTCEPAASFGVRLEHEARVCGLTHVRRVCVIGDGAAWIWNLADEHFPTATRIIDLYHAREHYLDVAKLVFTAESRAHTEWTSARKRELDAGNVTAVVNALGRLTSRSKKARKARDTAMQYFWKNADRMRYAEYRANGLFVGSGVVEAGCKSVVGKRLKQSGVHWTVRAAENILSLRCGMLGQWWDDFWEDAKRRDSIYKFVAHPTATPRYVFSVRVDILQHLVFSKNGEYYAFGSFRGVHFILSRGLWRDN